MYIKNQSTPVFSWIELVMKNLIHRTYIDTLLKDKFKWNMMLFLMGARQVGKTTVAHMLSDTYKKKAYFNWDNDVHRRLIISGQKFVEQVLPIHTLGDKPLIIFDELHKYPGWKNYIKGFHDQYKDHYNVIVTGSAHLNVFQKGGDSLMGRYFPFTIHPLSVGELGLSSIQNLVRSPVQISANDYDALYNFGGFPAPYIHREREGYLQWKRSRLSQLFREDIRDISEVRKVAKLEVCATLLEFQSGNILNRSTIANHIQVAVETINHWIEILKQFYYLFTVQPWSTNIPHAITKEPKVYLTDWSFVQDEGARFETFVACHLKKSVDFWNELGKGDFELYYLRDKNQREVDFLVTQNNTPWMLVEAKSPEQALSKSLRHYKELTKAPYAFQVTHKMEYVDHDCFANEGSYIVPAKTFLSQLV
jgi:predicted AAA+ superfamily ATPase